MNKTSKILLVFILVTLAFTCGYKVGDSRGYADGYNEGYRYDCKEEIAELYERVRSQSKALEYTDSSMKRILHQNDSLMHKEYFQKRHADSVARVERQLADSVRYHVVAKKYNDSLCSALGMKYPTNFVLENGMVNRTLCLFVNDFKGLAECGEGFDLRSRLDAMIRNSGKKKKGRM